MEYSETAYARLPQDDKDKFEKTYEAALNATRNANVYDNVPFAHGASNIRKIGHNVNLNTQHLAGPSENGNPFQASRLTGMGSFDRFGTIDHKRMASCMFAVEDAGVIKNIKDLMIDFSSEGFTIEHPDKSSERFLKGYARAVGLSRLKDEIFDMLYTTGNVFIWETPATLPASKIKEFRKSVGLHMSVESLKMAKAQVELPWKFTILNPLNVYTAGSKFIGDFHYTFKISESDVKRFKGNENPLITPRIDVQNSSKTNLFPERENEIPEDFRRMVRRNLDGTISDTISLDSSRLSTLFYHKPQHKSFAVPLLWPALEDVDYKRDLRMMDRSSAWAIMHGVTLFKLGSLKDGVVADEAAFKRLADMLASPTWGTNIIWNDAIEIESVYPDLGNQFGIEKYEAVDRDILSALGIAETIVNGRGGNYANSFLAVKTLLERLEYGRDLVKSWMEKILMEVSQTMGFRNIHPIVKFSTMSLKDETKEKQLVINLLDRNLISRETALNFFNENMQIETQRMQTEQEAEENGTLVPKLTPIGNVSQHLIDEEPENQDTPEGTTPRGGRPPGKDTKQDVERDTAPQGQGDIAFFNTLSMVREGYDTVEENLTNKYIKVKKVKYKKALSKEDRHKLDSLIYTVFSNMEPDVFTQTSIDAIIKTMPKLNVGVDVILNKLKSDFVDRKKCQPNIEELREMRSSAFLLSKYK